MDIVSIILISVGLSMDSLAVAISNGLTIRGLGVKRVLSISISLALFQAIMPLIGWFVGIGVESYIQRIDHWLAFLLLSYIGVKMIYEGVHKSRESKDVEFKILILIGQSLATSIDAFIVGISFAILNLSILTPVLIIGLITFAFAVGGLLLGKFLGSKLGKTVEIIGGIILIGIGLKILIEHLFDHGIFLSF